MWNTALQLLYLRHPKVCSYPKCTLFARWAFLGFRVLWETHHPQSGVKGRLQHLSVQRLHRALCWRSVLKLLVCSSCSSVWFHSRPEIPVWSPQGSLSSLARDLKQQEFGLPSFSKAETCANPYLSPVLCLIHLLILPPPFGWAFLFPSLYRNVNRCRDTSQSWSSVCCMHKEVLGKYLISKMVL